MTGPPDLTERQVSTLKITIDRTLCVGFGDCVEVAPDAFDLDDDGIAVFRQPELVVPEVLIEACRICPVDALVVVDETDRQVVP